MSRRLEALLFLTLTSFWALTYPLTKVALLYVDPFQLTFLRLVVALPFLAVFIPRGLRPLRGVMTNLLMMLFGGLDIFSDVHTVVHEGALYLTIDDLHSNIHTRS